MNAGRPLAPCFVGSGTLTHPLDMARALETLESTDYTYTIDGQVVETGEAALVRLVLDNSAASIIVNGCIFLNISSFLYLDFNTEDGIVVMRLHRDGAVLELRGNPARDLVSEGDPNPAAIRMAKHPRYYLEHYLLGEEDEDED